MIILAVSDLVTFTEEIFNEKFHFLCSVFILGEDQPIDFDSNDLWVRNDLCSLKN